MELLKCVGKRFVLVVLVCGFVAGLLFVNQGSSLRELDRDTLSLHSTIKYVYKQTGNLDLSYTNVTAVRALGPNMTFKEGDMLSYHYKGLQGREIQVSERLARDLNTLSELSVDRLQPHDIHDFPVVTGASSNHFKIVRGTVRNIQTVMPGHHIYYFDLGLKADQVEEVKQYCGVTYVKLDLTGYPEFTKNLMVYSWKPIIWQYMLTLHSVFLWADASIRFNPCFTNDLPGILQKVETNGAAMPWPAAHRIYNMANPGIYIYIPADVNKLQLTLSHHGGYVFLSRKRGLVDNVVKWLMACSLTEHCIAPPGAKVPCNFNKGGYWMCHRYDATTFNTLMVNYFDYDTSKFDYKKTKCSYVAESSNSPIPNVCNNFGHH